MSEIPPTYWANALQGLCHWVSYKQQYFDAHKLPEGAIVAELTQLLSAGLPTNLTVECERYYKDFYDSGNDKRMDICIGIKPEKKNRDYGRRIEIDGLMSVVEVKRLIKPLNGKNEDFSPIRKDFEKIYQAKKSINKNRLRTYALVVGQKGLSKHLFSKENNTLKRDLACSTKAYSAKIKMTRKSYSTNKDAKNVTYAALIEVS